MDKLSRLPGNHALPAQVDLSLSKELRCKGKNCDSDIFIRAWNLKSLSAIASPTGKTLNMNFELWVCIKCHKIKELPK